MESIKAGLLNVYICDTRTELGDAAAARAATAIRGVIAGRGHVNVVFASAPSQNETLDALVRTEDIDWQRVTAFHMDEYIGAAADAPYSFRRYLIEHLVSRVPIKQFYGIRGEAKDPQQEAREYSALLKANPPHLCIAGIGENGHLAFNDPPVANFSDPLDVKIVSLDKACREQQVADGAFPSTEKVPARAITLTIPRLFRIPTLVLSVPGARKSRAVRETVTGPIGPVCPASILRTHRSAHLYLDHDSAALIRTSE